MKSLAVVPMRQVILDTETTGLDPSSGHRIIEIGALEMLDRRLTGGKLHYYLNPERLVEEQAVAIHGLNNAFLADKPLFATIAAEFLAFIDGAELIIHNAPFDVKFLENELKLAGVKPARIIDRATVTDTLVMARKMHPGQKNSLDALCKRYKVDNSQRALHGALLDAQILSIVYLAMTGGQKSLLLNDSLAIVPALASKLGESENGTLNAMARKPINYGISEQELIEHKRVLDLLRSKAKMNIFWDA